MCSTISQHVSTRSFLLAGTKEIVDTDVEASTDLVHELKVPEIVPDPCAKAMSNTVGG